jgi:hypothetical protein
MALFSMLTCQSVLVGSRMETKTHFTRMTHFQPHLQNQFRKADDLQDSNSARLPLLRFRFSVFDSCESHIRFDRLSCVPAC